MDVRFVSFAFMNSKMDVTSRKQAKIIFHRNYYSMSARYEISFLPSVKANFAYHKLLQDSEALNHRSEKVRGKF